MSTKYVPELKKNTCYFIIFFFSESEYALWKRLLHFRVLDRSFSFPSSPTDEGETSVAVFTRRHATLRHATTRLAGRSQTANRHRRHRANTLKYDVTDPTLPQGLGWARLAQTQAPTGAPVGPGGVDAGAAGPQSTNKGGQGGRGAIVLGASQAGRRATQGVSTVSGRLSEKFAGWIGEPSPSEPRFKGDWRPIKIRETPNSMSRIWCEVSVNLQAAFLSGLSA